jgi:8-amino-7-oxononanoate synthase
VLSLSVFEQSWQQALAERRASALLRQHKTISTPQGVEICVDGQVLLAFCSNDYLGLANHSEIKKAAIDAIESCGVGSGASHLVVGHHQEHALLEQELAEFTHRERALVFSSGYMANLAVVSTLVGKHDVVLEDKLNHASLIDGGLLSGARFQRYLHNDLPSLAKNLERFSGRSSNQNTSSKQLVVTDGVFSMDGDVADLKGVSGLCHKHDALLMVDDAHGLGVLGFEGRGTVSESGLTQDDVPVLVGTFGKAFGTTGAFVAGSAEMIEFLTQMARPYIYTTAIPPSMAAATRKSLMLVQQADDKRAHLSRLIAYFRKETALLGYDLMPSNSPIQPILIGETDRALALSAFLLTENILVTAIRPPTVPNNTARLRVTLSAAHSITQVDRLLSSLASAKQKRVID